MFETTSMFQNGRQGEGLIAVPAERGQLSSGWSLCQVCNLYWAKTWLFTRQGSLWENGWKSRSKRVL